jgi:hypothetical protein
MEAITRIVADSLARHGLDRPIDPRRLQWSRWFRCNSPHSLLVVPSKPGIYALAEEVMDLGGKALGASKVHVETDAPGKTHVGTAALGCPERSSVAFATTTSDTSTDREGHDFSRAVMPSRTSPALAAEGILAGAALQRCDSTPLTDPASAAEVPTRRMLAVRQFSEDDDMAFTLDRMFTCANPMRARLASGRFFLRFVVIEDRSERRSICTALNQWMQSSAEKATGLPADFSTSLELNVARTPSSASARTTSNPAQAPKLDVTNTAPYLDSGANKNLHCPHPLPSGF